MANWKARVVMPCSDMTSRTVSQMPTGTVSTFVFDFVSRTISSSRSAWTPRSPWTPISWRKRRWLSLPETSRV